MKKIFIKMLSFSPYLVYQKIKNYKKKNKRIKKQKKIINFYIANNDVKKIQIGCGSNFLDGWLNTDIINSDNVAFLDAGSKFAIESDSFDYVFSEHLIEHLKVDEQINMLQESYRILKKDGVLRIATPSLDFLFDLYANPESLENKKYVDWVINNIAKLRIVKNVIIDTEVLHCYVINNFFKDWGHEMIHNYESMSKLALQYGYSQVRQCVVNQSDISCLNNIEKHGTMIPKNINMLETMVIEMIK